MDKVIVGKIVNTHGIKGELKISSSSDFIDERFKKGQHLWINYEGQDIEVEVVTHRTHKGHELVAFKDLLDINLVEKYKGSLIYALKDTSLLDDDEYYIEDLVGCDVYMNNECIGQVSDVQLYDHHDLLEVKMKNKKILIPYVDAFVKDEDIENKRIDVELIEGFINED